MTLLFILFVLYIRFQKLSKFFNPITPGQLAKLVHKRLIFVIQLLQMSDLLSDVLVETILLYPGHNAKASVLYLRRDPVARPGLERY
jgi:hypothetical protein